MPKKSRQALIAASSTYTFGVGEDVKNQLYFDTKGKVTIGVGNNVNLMDNFMKLNLVLPDGHTLTEDEMKEVFWLAQDYMATISNYNTLNNTLPVGSWELSNGTSLSGLQIAQPDIDSRLRDQLNSTYNELS
jgi:hypothetical protein